jgi:site-specific recombinase XerD
MDEAGKVPRMLEFPFGEAAETAQRGASRRLRRWSQAFEEWLAMRRQNYKPGAAKQAVLTWRRLLRERGKMPWELRQEDIEQHTDWMQAQGYAPTTISNAVGTVADFYRWCGERQADPECEAGFNPAAGARRPKIQRYAGAKLLSREEAGALLGILRRDDSPLGRRDYAFFLARLHLGAPLQSLLGLRWGQIEQDEEGAWVRWRVESERAALPGEAWEAIRTWLKASGRLEGMRPGDYIFIPLASPMQQEASSRPTAWAEERHLSSYQILASLKLYGRRVGIAEEKLTLMALRRTATRLRLEAGDSLEEMQAFLDSREVARAAKYRLKRLPQLPQEAGRGSQEEGNEEEPAVPCRKPRPFQPGEGMTHGLYAHSQPAQEVMAVLRENIQGVEEEITGLRILGRGLLDQQGKAQSSRSAAQLADAYTLTAERLARMIEAEKLLATSGEDEAWAEETLAMLDQCMESKGEEPVSKEARARALDNEPELTASSRRVVEEIAATRLVLRNTLRLAREAEQRGETGEFVHLTEIYSTGCNRLMKLLRAGKADRGRLTAYLKEQIESAIREVNEEWNP